MADGIRGAAIGWAAAFVLLVSGCLVPGAPLAAPTLPADVFSTASSTGQDLQVARGPWRFDPTSDLGLLFPPELVAGPGTSHYLIQYDGPIQPQWTHELRQHAKRVHDYLPNYAFLATMDADAVAYVAAEPHVRAVVLYPPAMKIDPALPTAGVASATVLGFPDASMERLLADLASVGALPVAWTQSRLEPVIDVMLDASRIPDVARLDDVAWIERARNVAVLDNEVASAVTQGGTSGAWPLHAHGIDGSSQTVSACDTGVNTLAAGSPSTTPTLIRMAHEAFNASQTVGLIEYNRHLSAYPLPLPPHPKIALYYSPQENGNRGDADDDLGHGTQTAGTLAGDAGQWHLRDGHDGVAYASRLVVCDAGVGFGFTVLNDYDHYWQPAYDEGARVSSNSWGGEATNNYTIAARQEDAYVSDHRDFVLVRSMGNSGPGLPMRPEAVAKNVIAVGATLNDGQSNALSASSSEGPAADGRFKPNVVAPGRCLWSSTLPDPDSYVCYAGTSAATPVVAGAAALVRDYFAKGYAAAGHPDPAASSNPSAALVRALLEISGFEIPGDRDQANFPNAAQGWGRVDLDDALYFDGDARRLWLRDEAAPLETGDVSVSRVHVEQGQPVRILLAWTDAAAAAGAPVALVNDLDLVVLDTHGRLYRGNAFVGNEVAPNQGTGDRRNVEEAVYISSPLSGDYYVAVVGINVPKGPQPFAIVGVGDIR